MVTIFLIFGHCVRLELHLAQIWSLLLILFFYNLGLKSPWQWGGNRVSNDKKFDSYFWKLFLYFHKSCLISGHLWSKSPGTLHVKLAKNLINMFLHLHENIIAYFLETLFNTLYLQDISDYYKVTTRDPLTTKASNLEVLHLPKIGKNS